MVDFAFVAEKLVRSGRYPALIFLFSRRLVEEKAALVAGRLDLLEGGARDAVRRRIEAELSVQARKLHAPLVECLRSGVGWHHAGLLPSAKRLVENLFVDGYLPVVFCTETFALGVNYPARTVVFGQTTKRGDDGFRPLTAREILQVAGRAGRRGQDRRGYVYVCVDPDYPEDAFCSAPKEPEPVRPSGGYTPEGVLRVVSGLGSDKDLLRKYVSKSYAAYSAGKLKEGALERLKEAERELKAYLHREGCRNFGFCWSSRHERRVLLGELKSRRHNVEQVSRGLAKAKKKGDAAALRRLEASLGRCRAEVARLERLLAQVSEVPGCSRAGPSGTCPVFAGAEKLKKKCDSLRRDYEALPDAHSASWPAFARIADNLGTAGFLDRGWRLTEKGGLALDAGPGGVLFAEVVFRLAQKGVLDAVGPSALAGLAAGALCESWEEVSGAEKLVENAIRFLRGCGLDVLYSGANADAVSSWAEGVALERCACFLRGGPGDFVVLARRAAEVLRGIANGSGPSGLWALAVEAHRLVWRGEVAEVLS